MYTKLAYVQGVQHSLVEAGYLAYNNDDEARADAAKLASCLTADPTEVEFGPEATAEIADTLMQMKSAAANAGMDAATARLETAAGNIKQAMNEGGEMAPEGAAGAGMDTNAKEDYDVSSNGATASPAGAGSTTGDESNVALPAGGDQALAPEGKDGAGMDTNAKAKYDTAANGVSSVAERQTTGDELKVAAAWGAKLAKELDPKVKVATVRELTNLSNDVERQALVDYVNDEYGTKQASASDEDILAALAAASR